MDFAQLNEKQLDALREVSAYLNAFGKMLKMTLIPSVPVLSLDIAGALFR